LIDAARAAPVAITKYDRPVVVMVAVEEFGRLKARQSAKPRRAIKSARTK
jgi:PHD/YefM family antitoxin component YafN of YafNO toxin-antitoxin module